MATTIEQLVRWLSVPREHERLEFKEAKRQFDPSRLFKYCVALANEGGGKLVLGVTDKQPRRIVGTESFRSPGGIKSRILDKLRIYVEVEEIAHPDGRVLVFHVPSRPTGTAYDFEGAYLMRAGDDTVPMTEDRLRSIFNEGKPDWLSDVAKSSVAGADVVQFIDTQSYFDMLGLPYPETRDSVLERLANERLIYDRNGAFDISNLCALLFAKRLSDFAGVERKAPRVIVYGSKGKLDTILDKPGVRGYAVGFERLVEFVVAQTPINEIIERAIRREIKMFPEGAIRELIANALIHQDFNETGTSVVIEIYADRIEISNPGSPFVSPDRFIDEYRSRNERLANLMRRLGICEEKGSGIDKVVSDAEMFQLPAPDFRAGERRTTAILFGHRAFEHMDRNDRIRACYQHCCLRYVMNERMSNQSLRERFRLPEDKAETVSRIIRDTMQAGQIKSDNPENQSKRYARYAPYWA
jgi:ATP-dependent DNA helicase RecG